MYGCTDVQMYECFLPSGITKLLYNFNKIIVFFQKTTRRICIYNIFYVPLHKTNNHKPY